MLRLMPLSPGSGTVGPVLLAVIALAVGFAFGSHTATSRAQEEDPIPPEGEVLLAPVWQAFRALNLGYLDPEGDPITPEMLINGALHGMAAALGDPNSAYLEPVPLNNLNMRVAGETVGIGVVINTDPETGQVRIGEVLVDSPAEKAGLQAGDIFVTVDGEDVAGMTRDELVARVRGEEGTTVDFTVRRGEELVDVTVTRGRIPERLVNAQLLDGNIGYLHIRRFTPVTRGQLDDALERLNAEELDGLILDLRDNAGGSAGGTVEVASAFIESGPIFFEQLARREVVFDANGDYLGLDLPIAVIVNNRTQSAAEVFAAALRDYGLATIIGETTYGKGTVQHVEGLANGGGLRFTIARILTPQRETYNGVGITPDLPVALLEAEGDEQVQAAVAFLQALAEHAE